jgi:predicted GNAT family N-acyltransferase
VTRDDRAAPQADAPTEEGWFEALAARMIPRAAPLRFDVVRVADDLRQVYRLRRAVVIEKGWAPAEDIGPDGECDDYDAGAVHVAGWDGTALVAASRLVLTRRNRTLPAEEAFGIRVATSRIGDVGRVAVSPDYRGAVHKALWALLCKTWLELRARDCTAAVAVVTAAIERLYCSWGSFEITRLAAPREYWGEMRYPVLIQPVRVPNERLIRTVMRAGDVLIDSRRSTSKTGGE